MSLRSATRHAITRRGKIPDTLLVIKPTTRYMLAADPKRTQNLPIRFRVGSRFAAIITLSRNRCKRRGAEPLAGLRSIGTDPKGRRGP